MGDENKFFMGYQFSDLKNKENEELFNWTIKISTPSSWNEKYFPQTLLTSLQNGLLGNWNQWEKEFFFMGQILLLAQILHGRSSFPTSIWLLSAWQVSSQAELDCITKKLGSNFTMGSSILIVQQSPEQELCQVQPYWKQ